MESHSSNIYILHGGCICNPSGEKATILFGDSGQGKSSIILYMAYFHNYKIITDDVLIVNNSSSHNVIEKNVRFCGCCHRELPVDSFYVDKRTLAPDNYCKECRRAMSNARYRRSLPASNPLRYPVITEISDCTLRMYLILNALKVVRESVLRKRKRLCEAGDIE